MNRPIALATMVAMALPALARPARAQSLTPEVRARLFAPTARVRFEGEAVTVPMTGTDRDGNYKCPYFRVYIDGKGPFTFLFDTGAGYTVISDRVFDAVRPRVVFDRGGKRDVVELGSVELGGITLEAVWAIHDDGFGVDGILGFPSLGENAFMFDLAGRRLTVSRRSIVPERAVALPYLAPLNVPTVPVSIGERSVQILIDTGDDAYGLELRNEELGATRIAHPPGARVTVMNGPNEQSARVTSLVDEIQLGPWRARSAVIAVNDDLPVGDLGYEVLRQFRFAFEPRRKVVYFEPLFAGAEFVVPPERSAGFGLRFDGSGRVTWVIADSPVAAAGLAVDDAIVTLDGAPVATYSRQSWDTLLARSTSVRVDWRRGTQSHFGEFQIFEIR